MKEQIKYYAQHGQLISIARLIQDIRHIRATQIIKNGVYPDYIIRHNALILADIYQAANEVLTPLELKLLNKIDYELRVDYFKHLLPQPGLGQKRVGLI